MLPIDITFNTYKLQTLVSGGSRKARNALDMLKICNADKITLYAKLVL